jgi:hypothetical protein
MDKNLEFLHRFISTYPGYDWTSSVLAYFLDPAAEKENEKLLELNSRFFLVIGERVFACNGTKGYLISKIYWSLMLSTEKEYSFTQALNDLQWYTGKEHSEKDILSLVRDDKLLLDSEMRCFKLNPHEEISRLFIAPGPHLFDLLWGFFLRGNDGDIDFSRVLEEAPFLKNHPAFLQNIKGNEAEISIDENSGSTKISKTLSEHEDGEDSICSESIECETLLNETETFVENKDWYFLHRFLLSYPEKVWSLAIVKFLFSLPTDEITKQFLESAPRDFLVIGDQVIAVARGAKEFMTAKIYWTLVILKKGVYRFDRARKHFDAYTGKKHKIIDLQSIIHDERLTISMEDGCFSLNHARPTSTREVISTGTEVYELLVTFVLKEGKGKVEAHSVLDEAPFLKNHPICYQKMKNLEISQQSVLPIKSTEISVPQSSIDPVCDKNLTFLRCVLLNYPEKDWTLSALKYLLAKSSEENTKKFLESESKRFIIVGTRVFVPSGNGVKGYLTTKIYWNLVFSGNKEYSFDSALKDFDNFTGKTGHTDNDLYSLVQDSGLFNDWVNRCFTLNFGHRVKVREPIQPGPQLYDYLLHFLSLRNGCQALNVEMIIEEAPFLRQHPRLIDMMKESKQNQQSEVTSVQSFKEIPLIKETPKPDSCESDLRKNLDFLHHLLLAYPGKKWTVSQLSFLLGESNEEKTEQTLMESSLKLFLTVKGYVFPVVDGAKGFMINKIFWTLAILTSPKYSFLSALKAFDKFTGKSGHSESDLYALVQDDRIINDWENRCFTLNPKKKVPILQSLTPGPEVYDLLLKVKINGKLQSASELIQTAPFLKNHPRCFNRSGDHPVSRSELVPVPSFKADEKPKIIAVTEVTNNRKNDSKTISLERVYDYLSTMPEEKRLPGVALESIKNHFSFVGKDKNFSELLEADKLRRFIVDIGLVFVRVNYRVSSLEDYFIDLLCFHLKVTSEKMRFNHCSKFLENKLKTIKRFTAVPDLEKRLRSDSRFFVVQKKEREYICYNRDPQKKKEVTKPAKIVEPQVSKPVDDRIKVSSQPKIHPLNEKLVLSERNKIVSPFSFPVSSRANSITTPQTMDSLVAKLENSFKTELYSVPIDSKPVKRLPSVTTKPIEVLNHSHEKPQTIPYFVNDQRMNDSFDQLSLFTADCGQVVGSTSLSFARIVHENYSEEFMNFDNEKPKDPLFFNEKKEFTSLHCLFYENPQQKQKQENPLYYKLLNYFEKSSSKPDSSSSSLLVIDETPLQFLAQYSSAFPFDYDRDRVEVLINPLYFQRKQSFYSSYSSNVRPLLIPWSALVSSGSFDLLIAFLNLHEHKGDYYEFLSFLFLSFPEKNRTTECSYDEFCEEIAKNNIQLSQRILFLLDTFILESVTNRNKFPVENHSFQLFSSESTFVFCLDLQFSDEISKLSLLPVEDLQGIYSFLVGNFTARDEEFVGVVADQTKKGIFLGNVSFDFIESEAYDEAEVDYQNNKNRLHMKGIFPLSLVYALLRKEDLIVVVQQFYNPLMFLSSSWIDNWDCVFFSSFSSKSSVHNVMKRLGIESSFSQDLFQSSLINLDEEDLLMYFPVGKRNHSLSQPLPWGLNSSDLKNFYHLTCRE